MVNPRKAKGSRFEILIYNDFKTYLTDVKRVGGSGTQGGENGDIICSIPNPSGTVNPLVDIYCVECKHYNVLTFSLIDKWWEKIKRQSKEINMSPLLIYRQNRQKIMIRCYGQKLGYGAVVDMKYSVWKTIMKKVI